MLSMKTSNTLLHNFLVMKDVKEEVYGTRPSNISRILQTHKIPFLDQIWFITCRRSINPNPTTRYLVLIESSSEIDLRIFNPDIPIYRISFDHNRARLSNLRANQSFVFSRTELKEWIIAITGCRFVESHSSGSANATKLSRFFRENMGKAFSLSDVDFYITKKQLFIEEKGFVRGMRGYLGEGQYYTFLEILSEVCRGVGIYIVLNHEDKFHMIDLSRLKSFRKVAIPRWGSMIEFDLEEAINEAEFVKRIS